MMILDNKIIWIFLSRTFDIDFFCWPHRKASEKSKIRQDDNIYEYNVNCDDRLEKVSITFTHFECSKYIKAYSRRVWYYAASIKVTP